MGLFLFVERRSIITSFSCLSLVRQGTMDVDYVLTNSIIAVTLTELPRIQNGHTRSIMKQRKSKRRTSKNEWNKGTSAIRERRRCGLDLAVLGIFAQARHILPDIGLSYHISFVVEGYPFPHTVLWGRSPDTPSTSANDQVAWSVIRVRLHSTDGGYMDLGILRHITHFSARKGPPNRSPMSVRVQIHSPERQIFHGPP